MLKLAIFFLIKYDTDSKGQQNRTEQPHSKVRVIKIRRYPIRDKQSHPPHRWLHRACDDMALMVQQHFSLQVLTYNDRCRSKRYAYVHYTPGVELTVTRGYNLSPPGDVTLCSPVKDYHSPGCIPSSPPATSLTLSPVDITYSISWGHHLLYLPGKQLYKPLSLETHAKNAIRGHKLRQRVSRKGLTTFSQPTLFPSLQAHICLKYTPYTLS